MPLALNAIMTFASYEVEDTGTRLRFVCANPGGGEPSDYSVFLTDADLAGISSTSALKALVTSKLNRQYRSAGIATKLDALIGQSITI